MNTENLDPTEDEIINDENVELTDDNNLPSGKFDKLINDGEKKYKLSGMYKDWFLDYASYVILERAVPHITDGLKPVQRRILHAMKRIDDGRYNKVANIVGQAMQFHPHGDASIKDALVQLGQKDILVDCQGNWGNILTGDAAAAGRYIEARLSKFANEVVFNNKTTDWTNSYDGRNKEPINLPIKFPLLLAQGSEGIAVGLASKILPHNFNELIEASILYLKGEEFDLQPDFPTGGYADTEKYNQGLRGGQIKIRAKIQKIDKNTLSITEIPFGKTTTSIIESIIKANDKGKIKIKRIDDNTAENVEITISLYNDTSPDKTIDALYACTDCEVSISPNCCVIMDHNPVFIGVDEILKYNTDSTKALLQKELEIRLAELESDWHYNSLEKIFFENKVYRILENDAKTWEIQIDEVFKKMLEYQKLLHSPIVIDDINKLVEKPVRKISKFDVKVVDQKIEAIEKEIKIVKDHLATIVDYTIDYFTNLKNKYGKQFPRKTTITSFEEIEKTKVVVANAKLYVNKAEGFIGSNPKKIEDAEYVCDCSDIDDIIVFFKDGRYIVEKISDKLFIDKNILYVAVFSKTDNRTIYNVIYKDGKMGNYYAKRCSITGITRSKWYDLTKGTDGSSILWFTSNPNGEAETIKITLRPKPKLKKPQFEFDFSTLAIKNKGALGNQVSKNAILRITLKSAGISTIAAKRMWFDWDVNRLNEDERGELLGEFKGDENILAICKDGTFYTTNLDLSNRYQGQINKIEKLDDKKVYSAIYFDTEVKQYYIKRFCFEESNNIVQSFISEANGSSLSELSEDKYPQIKITYIQQGKRPKEDEIIDVSEFIGVKGFKAKGKRAANYEIDTITFIDPIIKEEEIIEDEEIETPTPEIEENLEDTNNNELTLF